MTLKRIALFAIGIALIIAVLSVFGLQETITALSRTNLELFAAAIGLQLVVVLLLILRIKVLVRGKGYVSFRQAVRVTLSGMFVSMMTPLAKLGGEPLKMYMLQGNVGGHNASAAVAIESIMELASTLFVVLVVALLLFSQIPAAFVMTFVIFLIVAGLGIGLLLKIIFTPKWLHHIVNWISVKMAKMMEVEKKNYAHMFSSAFYSMWASKRTLFGAFSLSVLMKLVEMLRLWVIFLALGIFLPFNTVVLVWTIILVVLFIPWLPGSLGLAEFGGISALLAFGVVPSMAASSMVLDRLVSFWLPLFIGLVGFTAAKKRGELPSLRRKHKDTHHKKGYLILRDPYY
ncbi:MAG: flippase-like domain-containing protein [Candidatus Aenigmatarchaeota archaeon]